MAKSMHICHAKLDHINQRNNKSIVSPPIYNSHQNQASQIQFWSVEFTFPTSHLTFFARAKYVQVVKVHRKSAPRVHWGFIS
jgi:hypothetical protein